MGFRDLRILLVFFRRYWDDPDELFPSFASQHVDFEQFEDQLAGRHDESYTDQFCDLQHDVQPDHDMRYSS
jgi:hypothetical protein